jgi:hypothetical protein
VVKLARSSLESDDDVSDRSVRLQMGEDHRYKQIEAAEFRYFMIPIVFRDLFLKIMSVYVLHDLC